MRRSPPSARWCRTTLAFASGPMFGSVAALADGRMFMGLYGDDLFPRLPAQDRQGRRG